MEETLSKPDIQVESENENISIDDNTLVRKCQDGDLEATERLIVRYQDRIYNVILKIVGNKDDAAELTQETFVKVIENIDNFQGRSSFYTWAFRIAVNLTLNYCQRNARFRFSSLDASEAKAEYNSQPGRVLKEFLSDDSSPDRQ